MRKNTIANQATQPSGFFGRMMGDIMAMTNRPRNRWLLTQLDLRDGLRGLEFGFGNGETLAGFLEACPSGLASGIDWSQSMVDAASVRNGDLIAQGRLTITKGDIASADTPLGGPFDRIWCSNVIQMIEDRRGLFARLRAALSSDGLLALCFQPRGPSAPAPQKLAPLCEHDLTAVGFSRIDVRWMPNASPDAFCIVARS